MRPTIMRKTRNIIPFVFLIFLAACTSLSPTAAELPPGTDYAPRTLYELGGLETLQTQFIEDAGLTRLILLVSPT